MSSKETLEKLFEKLDIKINLSGYSENDITKTLSLIQGKGKDTHLESLESKVKRQQDTINHQTKIASGGSGRSWKSLAKQIRANMPNMINQLNSLEHVLNEYRRSSVIVSYSYVEQKQKEFDIKEERKLAEIELEKRLKKQAEERRLAEIELEKRLKKEEKERVLAEIKRQKRLKKQAEERRLEKIEFDRLQEIERLRLIKVEKERLIQFGIKREEKILDLASRLQSKSIKSEQIPIQFNSL